MAATLSLLVIGCLLQGALCQVFDVILQKSIKALSGSCVTISCSFDIERIYKNKLDQTCNAKWISNGNVVFDSAKQINGELRGKLTEKDCTTTLNNLAPNTNNKYHFRLECNNPLKYSFDKDHQVVSIMFKDAPPSPTLTPSTLEVTEGTSVSLTCSAPAPCLSHPPTLTWTPGLGDSQETLQEDQDKTKVKKSVVTFTASHLHHGKTISCTATYRKQDGTEAATSKSLTLNISFAPQIQSTSDCTKAADQLTCSCETVGNPLPILQWHLNELPLNLSDVAHSYERLNDTGRRSLITVNQPQETDIFTLLCRSSNSLGSATQRFYFSSLGRQSSAQSQECSYQELLPVFIIIVVVLTAALVSALLFAIRTQGTGCLNPTKTAVMSQSQMSRKENEVSVTPEEDIYVNTIVMTGSDKPNTRPGHQEVARKSSEKKNEEGSDVIYSSVIWNSKKKKYGERSWDRQPSASSYMDEERRVAGGMNRNYVSNVLEMGTLYDNAATTKDAWKPVFTEYAQVNFKR